MADTNQSQDQGHEATQVNLEGIQQKFAEFHTQGEEYVRSNPTPAFLSAFGVGFILQLLPIGAIIGALVRLLFFAARPAIFIYGAVSLYKRFQDSQEHQR